MAQTICFTARCPHCGESFPLENVAVGEKINTWCPQCSEFVQLTVPEPKEYAEKKAAPVKKKPVWKWIGIYFASVFIAVILIVVGLPMPLIIYPYVAIGSFCVIKAIINAIINARRKSKCKHDFAQGEKNN